MTDRPLTPEEDDIALAGEYVLGVQDAAERAATERRIKADPAFARLVARWETDFATLNGGFPEVPAPDLMPRIEARLFGAPDTPTRQARRQGRRAGPGWWGRFLGGAVAAAALAALLLAALPRQAPTPPEGPAGPVLTATLTAEGQPLLWQARWDGATLTLQREAGAAPPAGQAHELWLIVGEAAPVSLGLLEAAETRHPLADLPAGAVLAVSLEPAGGSPSGAPTGPVLAAGQLSAHNG